MRFQPRRRALLRTLPAAGLLVAGAGRANTAADPWDRADAIQARFKTPLRFRDENFDITSYGAKRCAMVEVQGQVASQVPGKLKSPAPQSHDCYPAITAAIAACHAKGGGRVLIPAGDWYCAGPMVLRSNVHVHLAAGARLHFSANPEHYAKYGDVDCGPAGKLVHSRWQGNDVLNYSPMVYAKGQENIALTGADWTSIINGQGGVPFEDGTDCWWDWKGRGKNTTGRTEIAPNLRNLPLDQVAPSLPAAARSQIAGAGDKWQTDSRYLPALSEAGVPLARRVFGRGHYLRPCMVELIDCSKVLLQGYQINGAPFWLHHPVNSREVHIRGVNLESLGPNSDGFDPEACDHVLVEDCTFNTGDDCIAIKSGKNRDTQFGPTRNVLIQRCVMNSGHGAVTLGSEMAGGIEHVYARQLEIRNMHWKDDPLYTAIRLKTNMNRGGFLRHLYVRDLKIPNGVQTTPSYYKPLPGTPEAISKVASFAGAIITIDCDYAPGDDAVRSRPPQVSDIDIRDIKVGNVDTGSGSYSCFQAFVLFGPVATSFNGAPGTPIPPISRVRISDCDFGTPRNTAQPWFLHNATGVTLHRVTIAGKTIGQANLQ